MSFRRVKTPLFSLGHQLATGVVGKLKAVHAPKMQTVMDFDIISETARNALIEQTAQNVIAK